MLLLAGCGDSRTPVPNLTQAGSPAVVLDATEQIAGQGRRVHSIHLFTPSGELVVEEYAPSDVFHAVDHEVFSPLKRSLALMPTSA